MEQREFYEFSYSQKWGPTIAQEIGCQGVATAYIKEYNVPK